LPAAGETQTLDALAQQGSLRFTRPRVLRIG
jgi:hypothetical protein